MARPFRWTSTAMPLRALLYRRPTGPQAIEVYFDQAVYLIRLRRHRHGARLLCVTGDGPHLARRVGDFLKREAKRDLEAASRDCAGQIGAAIKRISVRDQNSRWGSCSTTGVLSFSWRLILAPPFVLQYLAAHEVAHLIEMNHSHRFCRLLTRRCP